MVHRPRAFLDHWAIQAQSQELALSHTVTVLKLSENLGFHVNLSKSDLEPSQLLRYLGHIFHTVDRTARPSDDQIDRLLNSIRALLPRQSASARELAQVLGSMEAMVPVVHMAGVTKRLSRENSGPDGL